MSTAQGRETPAVQAGPAEVEVAIVGAGLAGTSLAAVLGKAGRKAAEGANALDWHWWPGTNAITSHKHKTLEPCGRWGTCEFGCPEGAKASVDLI